jgi:serine/threonine protein kinase
VYEVKRVDKEGDDTRYACKMFDRSYYRENADEIMKQCFMAEMEINRKMRDPNIVEFKYLLRDEEYYYMFMEPIPGKSVDRIIEERTLPDDVVRRAFKQMVEAVYYIHRQNVVHLDIKPSNFIVIDDELSHIKLCDFGLAREINGNFEMHRGILGTPNFIAPEVLISGGSTRSYTQSVDVWALGCCLYSLLFGITPFESPKNSTKEVYALIKRR